MEITDIILVIEEDIDLQINRLMDIQDYREFTKDTDSREAYGERMLALGTTHAEQGQWVECWNCDNNPVSARFCGDELQLGLFLQGHYNRNVPWKFDRDLSSSSCIAKKEQIGMTDQGHINEFALHYEPVDAGYVRGQVFHNFNGRDYMVLEVLSKRNLVVMDIKNGSFTVALGINAYRRYPRGQEPTWDNIEVGFSWEHGIYLENSLSAINFRAYKQEYGTPEPIQDVYDYRESLKEKFYLLYNLTKDRLVTAEVREAARDSLYTEFGTESESIFSQEIEKGTFDGGYFEIKGREDVGSSNRGNPHPFLGKAR